MPYAPRQDENYMPDAQELKARYIALAALIRSKEISAAMPVSAAARRRRL